MRNAARFAALRAVRTLIQGLAGIAVAIPAVNSWADAKIAAAVALWGSIGVTIGAVGAFLQNLAEKLEALEDVLEGGPTV